MPEPWAAERVVDVALARVLIAEVAPALSGPITLLGAGWDNTVYRAGELVFRFPRRELGAQLLERELALLPMIGEALPVAVPRVVHVGRASARFGWPYAAYAFVEGESATVFLPDRASPDLPEQLAATLRALHAIPLDRAHRLGAPPDELSRLEPQHRKRRATASLAALEEAGLIDDKSALLPIFDAIGEAPVPTSLVHGDLYSLHVMLDRAGALAGIIDWGDVHIGHRAVDLAVGYMLFGTADRERFFAAYGGVDEPTRLLARMRATYHAAAVAEFAHATANAALRDASLLALDRLLDHAQR